MMLNTSCVREEGLLLRTAGGLRFVNPPLTGATYCNAQIDDYLVAAAPLLDPPTAAAVAECALFPPREADRHGWFWLLERSFPHDRAAYTRTSARALVSMLHRRRTCGWRLIPWLRLEGGCARRAAPGRSDALPLAALALPAMHSTRLYRRLWPFFERRFRIASSCSTSR